MKFLSGPQAEHAARRLCELRGQDPDELVQYRHPKGYLVALSRPRWKSAREEILEAEFLRIVIAEGEVLPDSGKGEVLPDSQS